MTIRCAFKLLCAMTALFSSMGYGATIIQKGVYVEQGSPISGIYVYETNYSGGNLSSLAYVHCLFSYFKVVNGERVLDKNVCSTARNPMVISLSCSDGFCSNVERFFAEITVVDLSTLHATNSHYPLVSNILKFAPGKTFSYDN